MARTFANAANYLLKSSPPNWTATGTIAFWFKPTWSSSGAGVGVNHHILTLVKPSPLGFFHFYKVASTGQMNVGWYNNGVDARIFFADSGIFTAGVWAHHIVRWAATGQPFAPFIQYFLNGVLKASNAVAFSVPTSMVDWRIGGDPGIPASPDGDLAEFARWNLLVSAGIPRLVEGYRADNSIDGLSTGLVDYTRILGAASPEPEIIGSQNMTVFGSPAFATHPPMLGDDQTIIPTSATATVTAPSPAIDMVLAISPTPATAIAEAPSPIIVTDPYTIIPASALAEADAGIPHVAFQVPPGLRIRAGVELAEG